MKNHKDIKFDCRYFKGDKPCRFKRICFRCDKYSPCGDKILIIKLAAMGDVLRTTSILTGLKRKYPNSHITWIVNEESYLLLKDNPKIDRVLIYNIDSILLLLTERFDLVLSFDKAPGAASLASLVKATSKKGFGIHKDGYLYPINADSEYAFRLGIDDNLKFKQNKKTYQEIIYKMAGLDYKDDEYVFSLPHEVKEYSKSFFKKNRLNKKELIVGLNTGSGEVFATKKWTIDGFVKLARMLKNKFGAKILLLGGPNEIKRNKEIMARLKKIAIDTGCNNSLSQFIGILDCCSLIVSADTLAMQLAIALKKNVVALFGPTCHQEIGLYGRGEKIVSLVDCAPCYKQTCEDTRCMSSITPREVFEAIGRIIEK